MMKASVYSRGAVIWVSSTSFQKSDIGWPLQPPKEKLLKFNGISMIMSKKIFFFSKHQNLSLNQRIQEPGWFWSPQKWFLRPKKPLQPHWPQQPRQPHWPHQPHQPFILSSKKFLIMMVWLSLAPKWPLLVPCCGIDHQKSNFSLIFCIFAVGGCWGQAMLLFWKLVDETQMTAPREYTDAFIITKKLF